MTQQSSSEWIERFARFGYGAKGIVYAIVGILAVQAAFTGGGRTTDTKGALYEIVSQPFGQVLLSLVGVGLIGYAMWRLIQALMDPENKGDDAKGIVTRIGYAVSGIIYAGLAFTALGIVFGSTGSSSSGGDSTQHWTARLMAQPFGRWLVGLVGAIVLGLAFYYFYKAFTAKFRRHLKVREMSYEEEKWAVRIGRVGLTARGVVFLIIGWFLMRAAYQSDASEARGLAGALETLLRQPYGPWLMGLVALGLVAYGIHLGVQARYRRILAPNVDVREAVGAGRR